jgi:putative transposase
MGMIEASPWLDTAWLLVQFGKQRKRARQNYDQFIMQGKNIRSPLEATRHQLLRGDDAFVERFQYDGKQGRTTV